MNKKEDVSRSVSGEPCTSALYQYPLPVRMSCRGQCYTVVLGGSPLLLTPSTPPLLLLLLPPSAVRGGEEEGRRGRSRSSLLWGSRRLLFRHKRTTSQTKTPTQQHM